MVLFPIVTRPVAVFAVHRLAAADYDVATRVSEVTAQVVQWAYDHDQWWVAGVAMDGLKMLDECGSLLIRLVIWMVMASP